MLCRDAKNVKQCEIAARRQVTAARSVMGRSRHCNRCCLQSRHVPTTKIKVARSGTGALLGSITSDIYAGKGAPPQPFGSSPGNLRPFWNWLFRWIWAAHGHQPGPCHWKLSRLANAVTSTASPDKIETGAGLGLHRFGRTARRVDSRPKVLRLSVAFGARKGSRPVATARRSTR